MCVAYVYYMACRKQKILWTWNGFRIGNLFVGFCLTLLCALFIFCFHLQPRFVHSKKPVSSNQGINGTGGSHGQNHKTINYLIQNSVNGANYIRSNYRSAFFRFTLIANASFQACSHLDVRMPFCFWATSMSPVSFIVSNFG